MNPRQNLASQAPNFPAQHHGCDDQPGTTENNESFSRESSCTLTAEDDELAYLFVSENQQAENQQTKPMPTTMEAESAALIERIEADPFHTPTLLSEAKRILELQLQTAGDKTLSFLDKRPSTAPFIDDMVRNMDKREHIYAFQTMNMNEHVYAFQNMHQGAWYTVEAFSCPLSLAALFLAKHAAPDRKLPDAVTKQLQVRGQAEIGQWVENSDKFANELAYFELGGGVPVPSKLFLHEGRHYHHGVIVNDPRPFVESGYEFNRELPEPWETAALEMHSNSDEALERLGYGEMIPESDQRRAYGNVDHDVPAAGGEPYWHAGAGWPLNLADHFSPPGWAPEPEFAFFGDDRDAAFMDAVLMSMRG
ncbi:hypothetical protein PG985_009593 [Apiospora marii]|uniref:Uncharacterized protein n=1 Tax=Apiospora marii TaxID=335849 RepID=A0ABR1RG15_9PEZI